MGWLEYLVAGPSVFSSCIVFQHAWHGLAHSRLAGLYMVPRQQNEAISSLKDRDLNCHTLLAKEVTGLSRFKESGWKNLSQCTKPVLTQTKRCCVASTFGIELKSKRICMKGWKDLPLYLMKRNRMDETCVTDWFDVIEMAGKGHKMKFI